MNITLKKLAITNFKGIRHFATDLQHVTNIYGENGTGKTSLFDAFLWLLFGKDSTDRKTFELKPIDSAGNIIPKSEVEVAADLLVDGEVITLKRVFREKWTKKRGEPEAIFTGNEAAFFWNDVPLQAGEYEKKISRLVDENIFKLITNTLYFNGMKWQDRRNVLETLAGRITNGEVFDSLVNLTNKHEYVDLMNVLNAGKSFAEYRAQIAAQKKKLKTELELIPSRIDEVNRAIAQVETRDFANIKQQVTELEQELHQVDESLMSTANANAARNKAIRAKQDELHALGTKVKTLEYGVCSNAQQLFQNQTVALSNIKFKIDVATDSRLNNLKAYTAGHVRLPVLQKQMVDLRAEWAIKNAENFEFLEVFEFDEHAAACPTCQQKLPAGMLANKRAELERNFNDNRTRKLNAFTADKKAALTAINTRGARLKQELSDLETALESYKSRNIEIDAELLALNEQLKEKTTAIANLSNPSEADIQKTLTGNAEYTAANKRIAELESELAEPLQETNNVLARDRKAQIGIELNQLRTALGDELQLAKFANRKNQLDVELKDYAQQLADLERTEFTMESFEKAKMDMLDRRINGMFQYVSFKLFHTNINGGVEACCDTLIEGVPFTDANNAAKINAGLDIINALCNFHGVWAPIFIDNRESINNLIDTKSQLVNLIVSTDKKLKVA